MGRPMRDLTGQRFERLTAIRPVGRKFGKNFYWLCLCDCGREVEVKNTHLTAPPGKNTVSCGCKTRDHCAALGRISGEMHRTHGASDTPEYSTYSAMLRRCLDPTYSGFADYGGRGITVCERWHKSFENFLADMKHRPPGTSLDRIDNDGNYEPGNCRWATQHEQARNSRRNVILSHAGESMPLVDWAIRLNIHPKTPWSRLFTCGWTVEQALTVPVRERIK